MSTAVAPQRFNENRARHRAMPGLMRFGTFSVHSSDFDRDQQNNSERNGDTDMLPGSDYNEQRLFQQHDHMNQLSQHPVELATKMRQHLHGLFRNHPKLKDELLKVLSQWFGRQFSSVAELSQFLEKSISNGMVGAQNIATRLASSNAKGLQQWIKQLKKQLGVEQEHDKQPEHERHQQPSPLQTTPRRHP